MKFIKKLTIYFFGFVFNKIMVFLLLPFYTRNFAPSLYGDNDLAITTVTMLVSVLFLELWTALLRFSYDEKTILKKYKVFTNVIILSVICLPLFVMGCIGVGYWQHLPNINWMILYGISLFLVHIFQFEIRAVGKSNDFVLSGIISSSVQLVLSFILVMVLKFGAETMLIAPMIGNIVAIAYIESKYKFLRKIKVDDVSFLSIKILCKFSIPLAINAIAFWGMTNINRYFARAFLGSEANGYIALASKFANLIAVLVQVYALAWQESAFENSNNGQRNRYYSEMLKIYLDIMSFGTAIVIIFTNILFPLFISTEYNPTQQILPIYYLSAFMNAISNFFGHLFNAEKKTKTLLSSTLVGAIVNIILLFILIQKWKLYAVPVTLTLGYTVNVIVRIVNFQKINKLYINIKRLSLDFCIIIASMILTYMKLNIFFKLSSVCIILLVLTYLYKDLIKKIINIKFKNNS